MLFSELCFHFLLACYPGQSQGPSWLVLCGPLWVLRPSKLTLQPFVITNKDALNSLVHTSFYTRATVSLESWNFLDTWVVQ